jgi:hypothetical protein
MFTAFPFPGFPGQPGQPGAEEDKKR